MQPAFRPPLTECPRAQVLGTVMIRQPLKKPGMPEADTETPEKGETPSKRDLALVCPIAHPLASKKATKKLLKLIKKGSRNYVGAGENYRLLLHATSVRSPCCSFQRQACEARRQGSCESVAEGGERVCMAFFSHGCKSADSICYCLMQNMCAGGGHFSNRCHLTYPCAM
jgi:hypothetical protein